MQIFSRYITLDTRNFWGKQQSFTLIDGENQLTVYYCVQYTNYVVSGDIANGDMPKVIDVTNNFCILTCNY